ncbi:MAG: DUF1365 family protein [Pseudomonadota bacterium]
MKSGALYTGFVVHRRSAPREHKLRYRVFSMLVDLDQLAETANRLRLFSLNRFNLFSLNEGDHGTGKQGSLRDQIREIAADAGVDVQTHSIEMLFFPRLLGYAFNPLTVYFCRDETHELRLVIYQVNNTFGERQFYALPVEEVDENGIISQSCEKLFYVSTFNRVEGRYGFRLIDPNEGLRLGITLRVDGKPLINAYQVAKKRPLSDRQLMLCFLRTPLMTFKVFAGILFEALKLRLKGIQWVRHVPAKEQTAIFVQTRENQAP